jgi:hypothetical protein
VSRTNKAPLSVLVLTSRLMQRACCQNALGVV